MSEFRDECLRTEAPRDFLNAKDPIMHTCLELVADTGRVVHLFKRKAYYAESIDPRKIDHACALAASSLNSFSTDYSAEHDGKLRNPGPAEVNSRFMHAIVGLYGEAGGMASILLDQKRHGEEKFDPIGLIDCIGGALWYLNVIMDELEVSEDEVKAALLRKLRVRYPDGFSFEKARVRDQVAERNALEGIDPET